MSLKQPKYERFCREYVIDYNGTQAAIRSGYSEKSARQQASRLLSDPEILDRVRELQKEQVERLSITQDYVMLQLLDTYKCCRNPTPVLRWDPDLREMIESGEYQFDSKGALRAMELIGKHLGMYDKKDYTPDDKQDDGFKEALQGEAADVWHD